MSQRLTNPITFNGDGSATIYLKTGHVAFVDAIDVPEIEHQAWWTKRYRNALYVVGKRAKKQIFLHRTILRPAAHLDVDHWDGDGLNNRRRNLRVVSRARNIWNLHRPTSQNSLGRFGVRRVVTKTGQSRFRARITCDNKAIHIGVFDTAAEAQAAYIEAAVRLRGFAPPAALQSKQAVPA